jgi:hypothetical protein
MFRVQISRRLRGDRVNLNRFWKAAAKNVPKFQQPVVKEAKYPSKATVTKAASD